MPRKPAHQPINLDRDWEGAGEARREGTAAFGPRLVTAWVLVMTGLDVIHRQTLRSLLPTGAVRRQRSAAAYVRRAAKGSGASTNLVSKGFREGLQAFESSGWIRRGREYILVTDQAGLIDYLAYIFDGRRVPQRLIDLQPTIDMLRNDDLAPHGPNPEAQAQRYRELQALDRLMRQAPVAGVNRSGTGSVRRVGPAGSGR